MLSKHTFLIIFTLQSLYSLAYDTEYAALFEQYNNEKKLMRGLVFYM